MKLIKRIKNEEKLKVQYLRHGWCPPLWYFLPGNNIRPESKEIQRCI